MALGIRSWLGLRESKGLFEFVVKSEGIQLVSGHPILAAAAKSNLEK
jgi:hypothetical protein